MKIQSDNNVRVVALTNLIAMCERISGTCHRFEVSKVTANRVQVSYSNPDEYGNECPLVASYPSYPSGFDKETPFVVLEIAMVTGGRDSVDREDGCQAFIQLTDCPQLYRVTEDNWKTGYEIRVVRHPEFTVCSTWDKDGCIQTWYVGTDSAVCDQSFKSFREASDWADEKMTALERLSVKA